MSLMQPHGESPGDFLAADFELPGQTHLRLAFEDLTRRNQFEIDTFDPMLLASAQSISLYIDTPELEQQEHALASTYRNEMFAKLGLQPLIGTEPTQVTDKYLFQSGEQRLGHVVRTDSVEIPAYVKLELDLQGNLQPTEILLLSKDQAAELQARLQENHTKAQVDGRLEQELGLSEDFLETTGLTTADKQALLSARDQIASLRTTAEGQDGQPLALPDLHRIHHALARAMVPALHHLDAIQASRIKTLTDGYMATINAVTQRWDGDYEAVDTYLKSLALERLATLNSQLRRRKTASELGTLSLGGFMSAVGGALGGLAGYMYVPLSEYDSLATATGSALGTLTGVGIGVGIWMRRARLQRNMLPFNTRTLGAPTEQEYARAQLQYQLASEYELALANCRIINNGFRYLSYDA